MSSFQCGLGIGLGVESLRWKGGEFTNCEFHGRIRYVLCWFSIVIVGISMVEFLLLFCLWYLQRRCFLNFIWWLWLLWRWCLVEYCWWFWYVVWLRLVVFWFCVILFKLQFYLSDFLLFRIAGWLPLPVWWSIVYYSNPSLKDVNRFGKVYYWCSVTLLYQCGTSFCLFFDMDSVLRVHHNFV